MVTKETKKAVIEFVRGRKHVSFVELTRFLDKQAIPTRGNLAFDVGSNVVVWAGISEQFFHLIDDLVYKEKLLRLDPCHWLVYLTDGGSLKLPIAVRPPKEGYRKPHWCPVVLNVLEVPRPA